MRLRHLLGAGVLAILSACATQTLDEEPSVAPDIATVPLVVPPLEKMPDTPERPLKGRFQAVEWGALPGWQNDDLAQVWLGFINNCKGLMRPISGQLTNPARANPRAWQPVCAAAKDSGLQENAAPEDIRAFMTQHLQPWRLLDEQGQIARNTVTGYYEPVIEASKQKKEGYQWPLFAVPDDLLTIDLGGLYPELAGKRIRGKREGNRVVPYDTRAEIMANPERQPQALVWAKDPIEAFFLQIQGSGQAHLDNGRALRLAYADHNGHPYTSIGKWLADQGELSLDQASMQNIKAWAQRNPHRVQELMNVNEAMVFFRAEPIYDPKLGPKGAYGIPLLAQRAIAVDPDYVPLGSPVFMASTHPGTDEPMRRLVFAQDTGAAIKGPARMDFYWGSGDEAGSLAGRMKKNGELWVLWPKQAGTPSAR